MDETKEFKDDDGLSNVLDDEEAFEMLEEPLDLGELRESVENVLYDEDNFGKAATTSTPVELLNTNDLNRLPIFQGLFAFTGFLQLQSMNDLFAFPPSGTQLARRASLQFALIGDSHRLERERMLVLEEMRQKIALKAVRYLDTLQLLRLVRGGVERSRTQQLQWLRDVMRALSGTHFSFFKEETNIIPRWNAWWATAMRDAGVVPPRDMSEYIAKWATLNAEALRRGETPGHYEEALRAKGFPIGEKAVEIFGGEAQLEKLMTQSRAEPDTEEISRKLVDLGVPLSGRPMIDARQYLTTTAREARELRDKATALVREIMELRSTNATARADYHAAATELAQETSQLVARLREPADESLLGLLKPQYAAALSAAASKVRLLRQLQGYRLSLQTLLSRQRGAAFAEIAAMQHAQSLLIAPKRYAPVSAFSWSQKAEENATVRLAEIIILNI